MPTARTSPLRLAAFFALFSFASCDGTLDPPPRQPVDIVLELTNLRSLDPETEGRYRVWVVAPNGDFLSAGHLTSPADGSAIVTSPISNPTHLLITVEPPGDHDNQPSRQTLLGGELRSDVAKLRLNRYTTAGIPLEPEPGTHVLFTPSNNGELGYPSHEDAGLWLLNVGGDTVSGSFYVNLTPLGNGWVYEGWVVRDYGSEAAVWISYGKFQPNNFRQVNSRDDTGLGPFSGKLHYKQAMKDEVWTPGGDWVANPYGYPVPGGLELPLDLNGTPQPKRPSRWTHVITIEPESDMNEEPWKAEPFPSLHPYRNPIGQAGAGQPRVIHYYPDELPRGMAEIQFQVAGT